MEPARVVRSAELRRVPGENPVRRPLRKPFLALLERGEVEVEVRGRNVGLCPIGMGEVQAVGVHLAGNRGGELDIVHDSSLLAHLSENLGTHVALGAYLVDAGRRGHDARIVAPRAHPRHERTLELLRALRIAAYRVVDVVDRRHAGENGNSRGRLLREILLVFRPVGPVPVCFVGEIVSVEMHVRRIRRKPLVPKAAKALYVAVEHDLLTLAPHLAEADHRARPTRIAFLPACRELHAAVVRLRTGDRLPRDDVVRPRQLDLNDVRALFKARGLLRALENGHTLRIRQLDFHDCVFARERLDLDIDKKLLLAPRRTREEIVDPCGGARHKLRG